MSVIQRVVWWVSQQDWVLLRVHFRLFENLAPNGLHGFPVSNYAMLDRITQLNETSIFLLEWSYGRSVEYSLLIFQWRFTSHSRLSSIVYTLAGQHWRKVSEHLFHLLCVEFQRWFFVTTKSCFHDTRSLHEEVQVSKNKNLSMTYIVNDDRCFDHAISKFYHL